MAVEAASAGQRVGDLLDRLSGRWPDAMDDLGDLVRALSQMYGETLARLVGVLPAQEVRRLARDDELLAGLLVLHDLHPDDLGSRVAAALDAVRPVLGAHAGDVELLGIDEDADGVVVRLRLAGSCDGCPSSTVTVRGAIERALFSAAPEITRVAVDGIRDPAVAEPPLLQIQPRHEYAGSACPAGEAAS
ncbi:MAG TPA: NifU family protein [Mycobacteriales bacterium]|nr:NifU family protein [Mycobacteriales bacterium]